MKKQVLQAATLLLAATALLTACDKAEKVIEDPPGGLVQVIAKAVAGDPDTRIGYSESGNRMNYTWGEFNTERFSVFVPGSNVKHDFLLKGGAHTKNGRFEGQIPEGSSATYAIYPGLNADPVTATAIVHDLSNQGLYTSTDALLGNRYHLMWSSADAAGGELNYQFAHRISMLKLELTFIGVSSKIKRVSILGGHYKANLNATNGELSYEDTGKGVIMASDATGFDLVNNVLTAYVYMFPEDLTSRMLTITAVDDVGKVYTSGNFSGRVLNAGTVYRLSKDMSDSDYIVAGNSRWAIGNLVADRFGGIRIGSPENGGLFFQFGSLVGWSGSANDDGTGRYSGNLLSIQVKPEACVITTWNRYWTGDTTVDDPVSGKGDPCRYYLGTPWRLPTRMEWHALFGYSPFEDYLSWGDETDAVGWYKEGYFFTGSTNSYIFHTSGLRFPISGVRSAYENGELSVVGNQGYYWSGSLNGTADGYATYFSNPLIFPSNDTSRGVGCPVRCIRE